MAVRLATDADDRQERRDNLLEQRSTLPLFDSAAWNKSLEGVLQVIVRRAREREAEGTAGPAPTAHSIVASETAGDGQSELTESESSESQGEREISDAPAVVDTDTGRREEGEASTEGGHKRAGPGTRGERADKKQRGEQEGTHVTPGTVLHTIKTAAERPNALTWILENCLSAHDGLPSAAITIRDDLTDGESHVALSEVHSSGHDAGLRGLRPNKWAGTDLLDCILRCIAINEGAMFGTSGNPTLGSAARVAQSGFLRSGMIETRLRRLKERSCPLVLGLHNVNEAHWLAYAIEALHNRATIHLYDSMGGKNRRTMQTIRDALKTAGYTDIQTACTNGPLQRNGTDCAYYALLWLWLYLKGQQRWFSETDAAMLRQWAARELLAHATVSKDPRRVEVPPITYHPSHDQDPLDLKQRCQEVLARSAERCRRGDGRATSREEQAEAPRSPASDTARDSDQTTQDLRRWTDKLEHHWRQQWPTSEWLPVPVFKVEERTPITMVRTDGHWCPRQHQRWHPRHPVPTIRVRLQASRFNIQCVFPGCEMNEGSAVAHGAQSGTAGAGAGREATEEAPSDGPQGQVAIDPPPNAPHEKDPAAGLGSDRDRPSGNE